MKLLWDLKNFVFWFKGKLSYKNLELSYFIFEEHIKQDSIEKDIKMVVRIEQNIFHVFTKLKFTDKSSKKFLIFL